MTDPTYQISDAAYLTTVMHLAKYPSAVSGVLLGTTPTPGTVSITRALPIAHSPLCIGTTPLSETALLLAEAKARELNLRIVGAYFGNEVADDASIGAFPTRLADRVRAHFEPACLLMAHAPSLAPGARRAEHCFRLCVRRGERAGTWARGARPKADLKVSEKALRLADALLAGEGDVWEVVDFEDHCLDPRRDWFNEGIEGSWAGALQAMS